MFAPLTAGTHKLCCVILLFLQVLVVEPYDEWVPPRQWNWIVQCNACAISVFLAFFAQINGSAQLFLSGLNRISMMMIITNRIHQSCLEPTGFGKFYKQIIFRFSENSCYNLTFCWLAACRLMFRNCKQKVIKKIIIHWLALKNVHEK